MTIAEQFYIDWQHDDKSPLIATRDAISELESRIVMIEHRDIKAVPTHQWMRNTESRITALEHPQDAKPQGREWVAYSPYVWCYYKSGETGEMVINIIIWSALRYGDLFIPYIEGDEKPDAPEAK